MLTWDQRFQKRNDVALLRSVVFALYMIVVAALLGSYIRELGTKMGNLDNRFETMNTHLYYIRNSLDKIASKR